ncbi:MAG: asparaginase [Actinomycetota bacterium]|nr:asparaginase [Actinomycetota bacterium]
MTVVVVSTGGTIGMRPDPATGKLVPAVSGEELVDTLGWRDGPPLELDDFARVPSFDMHGDLALVLADRVRDHCRPDDVAGIVVTHGTDTMEESVYLVDRLLDSDKPVVFTGAQRAADEPDSDGPRNLGNAIRVALTPEARGRGALIVFDGEVHAAREARKVHTSALRAFASPGYGPLGHVDGTRVLLGRRPERSRPLPRPSAALPRVDLIRLYAGADDILLHASLDAGSRAIVLEGTGRGNANERVLPGIEAAVQAGVPVVVCSRCVAGRVEPVYGRGGGKDLAEAGAVFAGDLAGPKARVLLQLVLAAGLDVGETLAAEAG